MPNHSDMNRSRKKASLPLDQRPSGRQPEGRDRGQARQPQGEPPPGLKDRDAATSDSYGNTRDSGESVKP